MSGMCSPGRTGRDRCPGVLALHHALDGGLARVRLPGGRISAGQLEAVRSAAELGSGLVELTARANIQLRGLPDSAAEEAGARLAAGGLLPSESHDRVRNVIAGPLAGRHPDSIAWTDSIVTELDRGLCADSALAELSGRFLFAVDDGSGLALEERADVTLVAESGVRMALLLAGVPTTVRVGVGRAAQTALDAAHAFLAARGDGGAWRVAELPRGAEEVAGRLGARTEPTAERPEPGRRIGPRRLVQRDGRVAITALAPLGRLDAAQLPALAAIAGTHSGDLRISRSRTLTILDVQEADAAGVEQALATLGLVVSESGWAGLTACVGLGACANARADVRAAAAQRASARAPGAPPEHWSACERRCGQPRDVPVSVVATDAGVVVQADERSLDLGDLAGAVAHLAAAP